MTDYRLLSALFFRLPKKWTIGERQQWMSALVACVDMLYAVDMDVEAHWGDRIPIEA